MSYKIDYTYPFKVLAAPPDADYFLLSVDGPDGPAEVKLPKLEFQRDTSYVNPPVLNCRVKSFSEDGLPVLSHIIAPYVYALYHDMYEQGGSFEARVVSVPTKPAEEPYIVLDDKGILYSFYDREGMLTKDQLVPLRFSRLTEHNFRLESAEGMRLPYYTLDEIVAGAEVPKYVAEVFRTMLRTAPELSEVNREMSIKNPQWPMTAARAVAEHLPEWFLKADVQRRYRAFRAVLGGFRNALLYLMDGCSYLNSASVAQRRALRQQLTDRVDALEHYFATLSVIGRGGEDAYVEKILDRLQRSGYLYHPAEAFGVMMLIFRLHPDKVGNYLNRIFESIFMRDLDNWNCEPFRSAFIEQFRIYVSQTRREIDALPLAESREHKQRLESIITAIALQLILADGTEDPSRTEALYFRYVSLLRPLNVDVLLSKAFLALMGSSPGARVSYSGLKEPMMMMTEATVMPAGDFMTRLKSSAIYSNGGVDVTVSPDGIQLSQTHRRDITERVIPEGLMGWLKPQIFLNGIHSMTGTRLRKITDHNVWWHDIEHALFDAPATVRKDVEDGPLRHAEIGDEVFIVVDGIEDYYDNNPTFLCHISDSDFMDGTGIMKRDQIVGYNLKQPQKSAFYAPDGSQLGFLARIDDIRNDGSYVFSLRNEVNRFIEETFNFEDEYYAIIAGKNERDYSAISRVGVGLFLEKGEDNLFDVGDVVRFRLAQVGTQGQIRGYIVGQTAEPDKHFDKAMAFASLLRSIGEADTATEEIEEEVVRDFDQMMSPETMRELIGIIRQRAIADTDLIKAYDYLRFGRLLALVIDDKALAQQLGTHAALLGLHQYYATNSRLDSEKLESVKEGCAEDPLLKMIYHRLEMVSWLGHPEHNAELYAIAANPTGELEGSIARMVLSYNLLDANDSPAGAQIASSIKQEIMRKLNVNNETRHSKYYGSESKFLEFKTSMVYPAVAPGAEMREAPEEQQFHILSRVAGLLNADGGRLYLGVNNDGFEVGLHDDMKYYEHHTAHAGRYSSKIRTLDNLCVFIENLLHETFGESVCRKINVSVDEEAPKGVILLDVKQSFDPVFLDGRLFVRQSGQATREYHGNAIDDFVRERNELSAERAHILATATSTQTQAEETAPTIDQASEAIAEVSVPKGKVVATSAWRPNVLHNYEFGYVEPLGYLYFVGDNSLIFSTKDMYMEPGHDDCRLVLTIPHEFSDGFLVMAFANERVLKIPLSEIFEKGDNSSMEFNDEYELVFAVIAAKDDALIGIAADNGGTLWRRAHRLAMLDAAHLTNTPKKLHEAPIHHTVGYEIAEAAAVSNFEDSFSEKLTNKRLGVTMRIKEDSPNTVEKINALVAQCHIQS